MWLQTPPPRGGATTPLDIGVSKTAVRPHACGDSATAQVVEATRIGSSPRVWGTFSRRPGRTGQVRFIPTRVGNMTGDGNAPNLLGGSSPRVWGTSLLDPSPRITTSVHPHACGEHVSNSKSHVTPSGSSPRVWGTCFKIIGLICDHLGSSPRVWGTCLRECVHRVVNRFIPTRVGNIRKP